MRLGGVGGGENEGDNGDDDFDGGGEFEYTPIVVAATRMPTAIRRPSPEIQMGMTASWI